jgi:hypothetical protein
MKGPEERVPTAALAREDFGSVSLNPRAVYVRIHEEASRWQ